MSSGIIKHNKSTKMQKNDMSPFQDGSAFIGYSGFDFFTMRGSADVSIFINFDDSDSQATHDYLNVVFLRDISRIEPFGLHIIFWMFSPNSSKTTNLICFYRICIHSILLCLQIPTSILIHDKQNNDQVPLKMVPKDLYYEIVSKTILHIYQQCT